jgi:AcrR family transcriptional regulator
MARRHTQRGRERRQQLLAAAAERFATRGFDDTSVSDVVDAVGVGKGVFYWYFESKEQILAELFREAREELRRRQAAALRGEDDPVRRMALGVRVGLRWQADHRHVSRLTRWAREDPRFAPMFRRHQDAAVADVVRQVKDAMVAGRLRDGDPVLIAHALVALTTQLGRTWVIERDADPDEVADLVVAVALHGLLEPDDPARRAGPPDPDVAERPTAW